MPGELVVGLTLKLLLLPWAAPRALPLCSLSAVGRGVGLCLYMVFSAAAECCCAIPGLCVVCGTLSTRVGLRGGRSGQVKSTPSSPHGTLCQQQPRTLV